MVSRIEGDTIQEETFVDASVDSSPPPLTRPYHHAQPSSG